MVLRLLAKDPEERHEGAELLSEELAASARALAPARTGRRWMRIGTAVALGVAAILAVRGLLPLDRAPQATSSTIAVFPFSVRGAAEIGYLGEGMVSLMSTKLDGAGELRSVDPRRIVSAAARERGALDPSRARALAERFGAGRYVVGDIVEAGGQLQITAALFDQSKELEPIALASVEGDVAGLFGLLDDLAA